jgi:hypothetical protein
MRSFGVAILLLFSFPALACFSGEGYEQNWNDSIALLWFSASFCTFAILVRFIRKVDKLYLPLTLWVFSCIPSFLEVLRYGNGDCGSSLMEVSIWPIYLMLLIVFYEAVMLCKARLGGSHT